MSASTAAAAITQGDAGRLKLSGAWSVHRLGTIEAQLGLIKPAADGPLQLDCAEITALDTAGAWLLQTLLIRLRGSTASANLSGLQPAFTKRLQAVETQLQEMATRPSVTAEPADSRLASLGRGAAAAWEEIFALLSFVGETAIALLKCVQQPRRIRWRPILFNIREAGFNALPIVGLLSFLLGVVVAYQGADQLRQYGANIFVADLVGVSMLREFAPLITAIIVAGRSGSAYAAQIGTMAVTEEIDAMRTLGIAPIEMLVLPKVIALLIALPLLTVFADALGVLGGMLMAHQQLDVGYAEFIERLNKAIVVSTFTVGIGKAPMFALIVALVGCFQGFRTRGGADSVGRQTTRSVVQAIFMVIVADALFSVVFSALDL